MNAVLRQIECRVANLLAASVGGEDEFTRLVCDIGKGSVCKDAENEFSNILDYITTPSPEAIEAIKDDEFVLREIKK